jgi:hypothetical protein
MEDRETSRMHKYGETKTTRIMMVTVRHVTAWAGRTKYQAAWFLLNRVYQQTPHNIKENRYPQLRREAWNPRWLLCKGLPHQNSLKISRFLRSTCHIQTFILEDVNVEGHRYVIVLTLHLSSLSFKHSPKHFVPAQIILDGIVFSKNKIPFSQNRVMWQATLTTYY